MIAHGEPPPPPPKVLNSWNIGWKCLGGGIQYLLPTMIEPKVCVSKIGLKYPAPSINFFFFAGGKCF